MLLFYVGFTFFTFFTARKNFVCLFTADAILLLEHKSMKYDITIKSILEIGAKPILQELCGIDLQKAKLMDLPQELFTVKLVDSPFFVEVQGKERFILLLEWQTVLFLGEACGSLPQPPSPHAQTCLEVLKNRLRAVFQLTQF